MVNEQLMNLAQAVSPFVLMGALFYFMVWRPQRKEQNERKNLLDSLKKGDEVFTIGGLCGKIVDLTEKTVILEICDGINVVFLRNAVSGFQSKVKK